MKILAPQTRILSALLDQETEITKYLSTYFLNQ